MDKLTIEVKQEHIDQAIQEYEKRPIQYAECCPVAQALKAEGYKGVSVGKFYLSFRRGSTHGDWPIGTKNRYEIDPESNLDRFITAFDFVYADPKCSWDQEWQDYIKPTTFVVHRYARAKVPHAQEEE